MSLAQQKCEPCAGGAKPLAPEQTHRLIEKVPGWETTGEQIEAAFKFSNFAEAMRFADKIAKVADEEDHHPDLHISWGKVRVELSTHAIGGLSANDFIMAAKINEIFEQPSEAQSI